MGTASRAVRVNDFLNMYIPCACRQCFAKEMTMAAAVERIVVQVTPQDKKAITRQGEETRLAGIGIDATGCVRV